MSRRIDRPRIDNSRLDNLVSWFAASVLVAAGVIYGLKFQNVAAASRSLRTFLRAPRRRRSR